jgi:dihydroorotase
MDPVSTKTHFSPTTELEPDERILDRFRGDSGTYWREHAWLAAIAMAAGMAILWAMGNPHVWTGAIGGLAAIAVRALYLASDETRMEWHLTNQPPARPRPARHRAGEHHDRAVAVLRRAGGDRDRRQAPAEIPGRRAGRDRDHRRGAGGHPHMTNALLHNARLIDPEAGTETLGWLRIEGGEIAETGEGPRRGGFDCGGLCLAPGLVDVGVKVGEPGERHKESLRTAGQAAAAGGVTSMVTRPDTLTPIDTPEVLDFVRRRARDDARVRVYPMAALTKGREGREMTEIGFLLDAGAVAFTDGDAVTTDTRVLSRCMTYARGLGALILGHPQDPGLSRGAAVTSGKFAALKGLPAAPPIAERMGLDRDLALVEMTGVRYHADQLSTAAALPALKRAKAAGLDVTAGVSIHHLTLNELDVGDFRTFFKLKPPLRSEDDRLAMVEAVADGTIDIVCSMHTPQDEESKRLPFEAAASGAVGLETLLPAALRLYHSGQITLPQLIAAMSLNPARRFGLSGGRLSPGAPADLVLFDPDAPFRLDRFTLRSKSKNTPFDGALLQGRVSGTWVGGERVFDAAEVTA